MSPGFFQFRNGSWTAVASLVIAAVFFGLFVAIPVRALDEDPLVSARRNLSAIYAKRADLRQFFNADWTPVICQQTEGVVDLEDWARKFGHKEHKEALRYYAPGTFAAVLNPDLAEARRVLRKVFLKRQDLQTLFRMDDWIAIPSRATHGIMDLEDWARQYGHAEHPELLYYSPEQEEYDLPPVLTVNGSVTAPSLKTGASFDFSALSADKVFVIDAPTRKVLLAKKADIRHPMASITKLMTAMTIVDRGYVTGKMMTMEKSDEVGGARLRVDTGTGVSVEDLMHAMIVGSANNAAYALQRSSGLSFDGFVGEMNRKAREKGLMRTTFADPSGLEVANISTAEEIAALAIEAFTRYQIRKMASTAKYEIDLGGGDVHRITNTNRLLTDEYNGLYVLGGKTGYLHESKWNLVVKMMDSRGKPLVIVVLGSESKVGSFDDAHRIAKWVWENYVW